jgi:hypothetical protein
VRQEETCKGCGYFENAPAPRRKYGELPMYTPQNMLDIPGLEDYSNMFEGTLCAFDNERGNKLSDQLAIDVFERLLDKFHFNDEMVIFSDALEEAAFIRLLGVIERELNHLPAAEVVKIIGALRFVAKRRSTGHREYFNVIHEYVGEWVDSKMRLRKLGGKSIFVGDL